MIDPAQVADYLSKHPDFFNQFPDLLTTLSITHPHGTHAVSITERQVLSMRDKVHLLEGKLAELIHFGEENDSISEKMHRLTLDIVRARDLPQLLDALDRHLKEGFAVPHHAMRIWNTPEQAVSDTLAEAIAVGGGNTFQLLARMYDLDLIAPIRERVRAGMPYVGWSAGANVAGPTIRTTNDMPIVEPRSLDALGLIPFQLNPHFTDAVIPNHGGETRSERLLEFIELNRTMPVLGLREGTALQVEGDRMLLLGDLPGRGFLHVREPWEVAPGPLVDFPKGP